MIGLFPLAAFAQVYKKHTLQKDKLSIQLSEGILNIIPLSEKAMRVQWEKDLSKEEREFVLINIPAIPVFKFLETAQLLKLSTASVTVSFNKQTTAIDFTDKAGKIFLSEKAGNRKLKADTIGGQSCYIAEQSFDSPPDEFLFGLGQFQDGHYNLRNVTRKLIQVNSQIAIPFLYSARVMAYYGTSMGLPNLTPQTMQ